eukprot:COSAG01_NODE_2310_length_7942_cov_7.405330_8_plen_488_part_00
MAVRRGLPGVVCLSLQPRRYGWNAKPRQGVLRCRGTAAEQRPSGWTNSRPQGMACCSSKPKARRQQAPGHADGAIAAAWSDGTDIGNQGTTVEYVSEGPFVSDIEPLTSEASQLFGPTPTGYQESPRPEDAAVSDTGGTRLPPPSTFNPRHPLEETGTAERQVLTLSPADASGGTVPSAGGGAAAGTMFGQQQQQQQQLSAGWEEHRTETGKIYYWNRDTDESTWDRPQQQAVALQEDAGAEAATEAAAKRLAEMEAAAAAEKEAQREIEAQRKQAEAQRRAEAAAKRRLQLQEAQEQQRLQQQQQQQQQREQQQQQQREQQLRQQQQAQQNRPPHQDRHTTAADRGSSSTSPAAASEAERMRLLRARQQQQQQQQQQLLVQSGPKPSRTAIAGVRSTAAAAAAAAPLSSSLSPGGSRSGSSSRKARQPLQTLEADKTSRTEWWQPGAEEGGEQGRLRDLLTRCALASTDPQGALVRDINELMSMDD